MKIKNPIGPKTSLGNGYYYQRIAMTGNRGYVKVWHHDKVIDRALSVASARAMAKRYAQRGMFND